MLNKNSRKSLEKDLKFWFIGHILKNIVELSKLRLQKRGDKHWYQRISVRCGNFNKNTTNTEKVVDRFPAWLQNLLGVGRGNLTILEVDIQGKKLEGSKAIFDGG